MNNEEFMNLSMKKKLEVVNKMLQTEKDDHLKNVSIKLDIPYPAFTKLMRDDGNYQFNQSSKIYEKIVSLEEYDQLIQLKSNSNEYSNEALKFLSENLNDIKKLLFQKEHQLILDPLVYDVKSKTTNKSIQVNTEIYNQFTELCSNQFPHLRQKDLISQCLLDFINAYKKT